MPFLFSFRSRASVAQCAAVMGAALALVLGYAWFHLNVLVASEAGWDWHRGHSLGALAAFYLAMIALSWPLWAISVNRLHDAGRPGGPAIWIVVPWLAFWIYPLMQVMAGGMTFELSSILMFGGWLTFAVKGGTQAAAGPNEWGPGRRDWADLADAPESMAAVPAAREIAPPLEVPAAAAKFERRVRTSPAAGPRPAFGRRR